MSENSYECPTCDGTGDDPEYDEECWKCGGAGELCHMCGEGLDDCDCDFRKNPLDCDYD